MEPKNSDEIEEGILNSINIDRSKLSNNYPVTILTSEDEAVNAVENKVIQINENVSENCDENEVKLKDGFTFNENQSIHINGKESDSNNRKKKK